MAVRNDAAMQNSCKYFFIQYVLVISVIAVTEGKRLILKRFNEMAI